MGTGTHGTYSPHAESQRYAQYEAKIRAVRAFLDALWRHRLVIAALSLVVAGLICGLLAVMGTFIGTFTCQDFTYGDVPPGNARAFLSDIHYEFAPADNDGVWTANTPTELGPFRIRAVSKNGFGAPRYSEDVTVTVLARDLDITISDAHFTYGDFGQHIVEENTSVTGLANGDRIVSMEYAIAEDGSGNYAASLKQLRIENPQGQDVTGCYNITVTDGFFAMDLRPIGVAADNAEKIYDGLEWSDGSATIVSGSLADGDTLQTFFETQSANADTYPISPTCQIRSANGEDVTEYYDIRVYIGTLTIHKRPIQITTGSAEKVYDGQDLTNDHWQITAGSVLDGHTLHTDITGRQCAAGIGKNTISLTVLDQDGADMTRNYDFSVTCGKLTVAPITLTFETDSAEKMYDGSPLQASGWRLLDGALLPGHTMTAAASGQQTYAGTSNNTLSVKIRDKNGKTVTAEGYKIVVNYGTLKVTKRPITITSGSAEKLYDRYPLTCHSFTINEGSLIPYGGIQPNYTGSQTNVGSSSNYFTVTFTDREGNNVTSSYSITYHYGTLTVHENPDYQDPNGGENGNGTGGSNGSGTGNGAGDSTESGTGDPTENSKGHGIGDHNSGTSIGFPDKPTGLVYATVTGVRGFSSETAVYFRDASYGDYNGSGWDAPMPDTTFYNGTLNPALIYIGRSLMEANKKDAQVSIDLKQHCPALLPYYSASYNPIMGEVNDCFIDGGVSSYSINMYHGYSYADLLGMTVSQFDDEEELIYRDVVRNRYLQIPESTQMALLQWAAENGIHADSPTLVQDIQRAIQNAAVYNMEGKDYPSGVDVAVYFLTKAKEGICQHFATAATLMYRAFGIPARYTVGFVGSVQNGKTAELTDRNAHAWVEIYVDGLGWVPIEVTGGGFNISGNGEPTKSDLILKAFGAEKYYDGQPFDQRDLAKCYILSGALQEGHRMEVTVAYDKNATKPGIYANQILSCKIYDENGKNVTDKYYNISCLDGIMTIHKRPITVTIGSAIKVYDGLPLQCSDYWVSSGSLLPNHVLRVDLTGSLTEPGTVENSLALTEIYSYTGSASKVVTDYYDITLISGYLTVTPEE